MKKTKLRRRFRRVKTSRYIPNRESLNHPLARIGLLSLTIVMGFLYVLQMNITATKGYDIRELEQQIASLEKDMRDLSLEALELQSMDRMIAQLPDFSLENGQPNAFLSTSTTVVAAR